MDSIRSRRRRLWISVPRSCGDSFHVGSIRQAPIVIKKLDAQVESQPRDGLTQLLLRRKILKNVVRASILQFASLPGVAPGIHMRQGRAAPLDISIVDENDDGTRLEDPVESDQKIPQPGLGNMRPPKPGHAPSKSLWKQRKRIGVRSSKRDLLRIELFGAGDFQDFLVDVDSGHGRGGTGKNLRPVAGAAGQLEDPLSNKSPLDEGAQCSQVFLSLRFVVNTLVFPRSPGVVANH